MIAANGVFPSIMCFLWTRYSTRIHCFWFQCKSFLFAVVLVSRRQISFAMDDLSQDETPVLSEWADEQQALEISIHARCYDLFHLKVFLFWGLPICLPISGNVLITIADRDKKGNLEAARQFREMGFTIFATKGTYNFLSDYGSVSRFIKKVFEGKPNIVDALENGKIQLVINTPTSKMSEFDDSHIRKKTIKYKIQYITTTVAALAATTGINARRSGAYSVKSL